MLAVLFFALFLLPWWIRRRVLQRIGLAPGQRWVHLCSGRMFQVINFGLEEVHGEQCFFHGDTWCPLTLSFSEIEGWLFMQDLHPIPSSRDDLSAQSDRGESCRRR